MKCDSEIHTKIHCPDEIIRASKLDSTGYSLNINTFVWKQSVANKEVDILRHGYFLLKIFCLRDSDSQILNWT
jgi:hypothetical protein